MKFQEIKNIESKVWKYPFFFFCFFVLLVVYKKTGVQSLMVFSGE